MVISHQTSATKGYQKKQGELIAKVGLLEYYAMYATLRV